MEGGERHGGRGEGRGMEGGERHGGRERDGGKGEGWREEEGWKEGRGREGEGMVGRGLGIVAVRRSVSSHRPRCLRCVGWSSCSRSASSLSYCRCWRCGCHVFGWCPFAFVVVGRVVVVVLCRGVVGVVVCRGDVVVVWLHGRRVWLLLVS